MCVVPRVLRVYGQTGLFLETGSMQPTSGILACAGRPIGTASDIFGGEDWFARGILKTVLNVIGQKVSRKGRGVRVSARHSIPGGGLRFERVGKSTEKALG